MKIDDLVIGKKYLMSVNPGKPSHTIEIKGTGIFRGRGESTKIVDIEYVSEGSMKGFQSFLNEIECERYVRELDF